MILARQTIRYRVFSRSIMGRNISLRIKSHNRVELPDHPEIQLTELEDEICTLLDDCTKWMKKEKGIDTACRIAGGWVRDKLLGSPSNDIDIALASMMGVPFAEHFVTYCSDVKRMSIEKIAKIESNPDRSKHLETARTTVLGVELDFVNLRSEEYAEHSRIPTQIEFGTPLQDAMRRDITINALFYNVHSRSVEDFTHQGLTDLKEGIIRTPLPPRETFMDDPLRVVRCVRFASRFGFDVAPEIQEAVRDPVIQEALGFKISRERVGEEIDKMMKGRDPLRAIQLIIDLDLYEAIFHIPAAVVPELSSLPAPPYRALAASSILHILTQPPSPTSPILPQLHPRLCNALSHDPSAQCRLHLACALIPFLGVTYNDHKGKSHPAVEAAVRESLKLGTQNHYLDGIPALFNAEQILKDPKVDLDLTPQKQRLSLGLLLRDKSVHNPYTGSFWTTSLLFSLVSELAPLWDSVKDVFDADKAAEKIHTYNTFVTKVEELDLPSMVDAKPILGGHDIVRVINSQAPGPWTGKVLARVIEWQLEHPEGTKEQCEAWLHEEHLCGRVEVPSSDARAAAGKRGKGNHQGSGKKKPKIGGE